MAYAFKIGLRQLRSKKGRTLSVITWIAILGVALGVSALLLVLSITSGFQREFRDKVVGVNAHVLVMKYGIDFEEYRDIVARAREFPEVKGAGPFLLKPMVISKDDRVRGILVKGIELEGALEVLDLPAQLVEGSLEGLRREGALPATKPNVSTSSAWDFLKKLSDESADASDPAGDAPSSGEGGDPARDVRLDDSITDPIKDPLKDFEAPVGRVPAWGVQPRRDESILSPESLNELFDAEEWDEIELPDDPELEPLKGGEAILDRLGGIVIGRALAEELQAKVGDRVSLVSPTAAFGIADLSPAGRTQTREFQIIGIFDAGFQEYDSRLAYVDLYEAQPFYGQGDVVTGVELKLHRLDESRELARRFEQELGGPFHTLDWAELNENLFRALQIQKLALALVVATIIFVAAFNVIVTLIMIVLTRRREIAILKAMGAPDRAILGIFSLQGLLLGLAGTAIGLVLGAAVVLYLDRVRFPLDPKVYLIDHLPVVVSVSEFIQAAIAALLISGLATLIPCLWAARSLPVEGLRNE
ncbi:MAG: ABC transporter permease [Sandaracinaceae bacterium]|nr:ABC transporter permease [Sandaracinaceae bacterium]